MDGGSPQQGDRARDQGISQSADCKYLATLIDSGISKSPNQNQDTIRHLWELLGGKQIPFPLDFNLEKDKLEESSCPHRKRAYLRIGPNTGQEQREKTQVFMKFSLLIQPCLMVPSEFCHISLYMLLSV